MNELKNCCGYFFFVIIMTAIISSFINYFTINTTINSIISSTIGWLYFSAWSVSFYPQVLLNYKTKNVDGISMDYYFYNLFDSLSYLLYNLFFYFDKDIQDQYKKVFGKKNLVELNDVIFTIHGFILIIITVGQIYYYDSKKKISKITKIFFVIISSIFLIYFILCLCLHSIYFSGMMFFYILSLLKLVLTIFKYTPQIIHNYKNKNTEGFSIYNPLLDFLGGICSLIQLIFDSIITQNTRGLLGDIVKLLLGIFTIVFDIILISQHFIYKQLYLNEDLTEDDDYYLHNDISI